MWEKNGDWRMHRTGLVLCKYFSAGLLPDFSLLNFLPKFPPVWASSLQDPGKINTLMHDLSLLLDLYSLEQKKTCNQYTMSKLIWREKWKNLIFDISINVLNTSVPAFNVYLPFYFFFFKFWPQQMLETGWESRLHRIILLSKHWVNPFSKRVKRNFSHVV